MFRLHTTQLRKLAHVAVKLLANARPTKALCRVRLIVLPDISSRLISHHLASCFCCTTCAADDVNAAWASRSLFAALLLPLVALFGGRHSVAVMVVATLVLTAAHAPSAHAFSMFGAEKGQAMVLVSEKSFVGSLPRYFYAPRDVIAFHERKRVPAPSPIAIESYTVDANIVDNYARTVISTEQRNEADEAHLATFQANLPVHAFVSGMRITIGDDVFVGKVIRKEEVSTAFVSVVNHAYHCQGTTNV